MYRSIQEDSYGHAHLQDKAGHDLSTRAIGDKFVVESKLDLYSGRMLQCLPISKVAEMSYDATNGVDANVVILDQVTGLPVQGIQLNGKFDDTHDALHFGDDGVKVVMDSDACNIASDAVKDDGEEEGEVPQEEEEEEDEFLDRHLATYSSTPLAKNRELYTRAMLAIREGRKLTGGSSVVVEMPYTASMCEIMPGEEVMVKQNTDEIACPAMRFIIKKVRRFAVLHTSYHRPVKVHLL